MNDRKMKLIDKLKARYPKLEQDPLMEDLESIMYEDEGMMGGEEEDMMGDEGLEMPMEGEDEDMMGGEEDSFLTEEDDDMASIMAVMGKPKKRKKSSY